jgi:hypothetical protein
MADLAGQAQIFSILLGGGQLGHLGNRLAAMIAVTLAVFLHTGDGIAAVNLP